MPDKQATLSGFDSPTTTAGELPPDVTARSASPASTSPELGFEEPTAPPADIAPGPQSAINLDYICFTGRYPFVFDAARLGYGIGHRENESFQWTPDSVSLSTQFLDNHFQDPDLDRFVDRIFEYEPDIAVIGDIEDERTLAAHTSAAEKVWDSYPEMDLILVPKCRAALENVSDDFILGYPNGKSSIKASDVAPPEAWRGRDLHILGGTPLQTWEEIKQLTGPSLTGADPANIVGLDSNVCTERAQNHGIYRKVSGGEARHLRDEYTNKRALVLYSLLNIKHFWWERGVWPDTDSPGRQSLPDRQSLLDALGVSHLYEVPTHDYHIESTGSVSCEPVVHPDLETLAISPMPHNPPEETPSLRTDETQAKIMEPCLPTPFATRRTFEAAGTLSASGTYDPERPHQVEPICPTCGGDLFRPESCRGVERPTTHDDGDCLHTAQMVSYDSEHTENDNHHESVARETDGSIGEMAGGNIFAFCSETCRKRGEARIGRLSPDGASYPDGDLLQIINFYFEK